MTEVQTNKNEKKKVGRGLGSLLGQAASSTGFNASADFLSGSSNATLIQQDTTPSGASSFEKPPEQKKETVNIAPAGAQVAAGAQANQIQNANQPVAPAVVAQVAPTVPPEARIWNLGVDKLNPNEYQPRHKFNKDTLDELAASIKEKGILQPIVARRHINGTFEIIAGERRWRAAQIAGLKSVPVILKTVSDRDSLELAIIENVQRENLNPIDEAEAYQRLASEFNLTQQQVAEKVGKDRATVANAVRLLGLAETVKDMVSSGSLSAGHAKAIASVSDEARQIKIAKQAVDKKLSVRAIEKLVAGKLEDEELGTELTMAERAANDLATELQKIIGRKVSIDYKNGKGKISISFYSDDELNELSDNMRELWQR